MAKTEGTGAAAIQAAGGAQVAEKGAVEALSADAKLLAAVERIVRDELARDREERARLGAVLENEPEKQDSNAAILGGIVVMVERAVRHALQEVLSDVIANERRRLVEQVERAFQGGAAGAALDGDARPAEAARGPATGAAGAAGSTDVRASAAAPSAGAAAPPPFTGAGLPRSTRGRVVQAPV